SARKPPPRVAFGETATGPASRELHCAVPVPAVFVALDGGRGRMAQINLLIHELKRRMQDQRLTYANLEKALKLSESSVKRMFAKRSMSLQRLEDICNLLRLEISDIVEAMHAQRRYVTELTREQEAALVADPKLLLFAYL